MKPRLSKLIVGAAVVCLACAACNAPSPRLNAPPHGTCESATSLQGMYVYMTDNALLADMTVCDIHFLPHRAMLNDLGRERLSRLASLFVAYGGQVCFDTDSQDEQLVAAREAVITDFLRDAGLDTSKALVRRGMPGGRGLAADQAILIKTKEGSYKPSDKKSGDYQAGMGSATKGKADDNK